MSEERRDDPDTGHTPAPDGDGDEPLDPRDWEETRGDAQQEPHEAPASVEQQLTGDEPAAAPTRVVNEDVPDNIIDQTREGEQPYQWHSGRTREHGAEDAVEFIDVKKSFGRNTILNGLNLGLPGRPDLDDPGPVGHGQVGVHQAHGRPPLSG